MPSPLVLRSLFLHGAIFLHFSAGLLAPLVAREGLPTALQATCRIEIGPASGTCFFVAVGADQERRTFLVTAGHVFEGSRLGECNVVARARTGEEKWGRQEWKVPIRKENQPLWVKHPDLDAAVLPVTIPEGLAIMPLTFDQIASESHFTSEIVATGDDLFIPGFPAKLEGNGVGWPVTRKGIVATYPLFPAAAAKTFLVHSNTFGGDSGAPVLALVDGQPLVVGLISGMQRQTDKTSLPFAEYTVHTPLGLAIVVSAPFVRETVERAQKSTPAAAPKAAP